MVKKAERKPRAHTLSAEVGRNVGSLQDKIRGQVHEPGPLNLLSYCEVGLLALKHSIPESI